MQYHVYILQSINYPAQKYVGIKTNIERRLQKHNEGGSPHTSKYKPWKKIVSVTFEEKVKAYHFEKYLKSH